MKNLFTASLLALSALLASQVMAEESAAFVAHQQAHKHQSQQSTQSASQQD